MRRVSDLLPEVYRKIAGSSADEEGLALALWPVVVGEGIAARTRPLRLYGTKLMVEVAAQDWRKQLAGMSREIVARLNGAAGRNLIEDVQFLVATRAARLGPGRASCAAGGGADEAEAIADPYLRRQYRISRHRARKK